MVEEVKGLTSLVEPSFSHNTDFIHAGAEDCLGWEGAADKLVEVVQTLPAGQVPDSGSVKKNNTMPKKGERHYKTLFKYLPLKNYSLIIKCFIFT